MSRGLSGALTAGQWRYGWRGVGGWPGLCCCEQPPIVGLATYAKGQRHHIRTEPRWAGGHWRPLAARCPSRTRP